MPQLIELFLEEGRVVVLITPLHSATKRTICAPLSLPLITVKPQQMQGEAEGAALVLFLIPSPPIRMFRSFVALICAFCIVVNLSDLCVCILNCLSVRLFIYPSHSECVSSLLMSFFLSSILSFPSHSNLLSFGLIPPTLFCFSAAFSMTCFSSPISNLPVFVFPCKSSLSSV